MSTNRFKLKNVLIGLGMAVSASAWATPLSSIGITGGYIVWDGAGVTLSGTPVADPDPTAPLGLNKAIAALGGNAGAPGGNVELSKFGGPLTTLTGIAEGRTYALSSLVLTDWTANGGALAKRYIGDAAAAAGLSLTTTQLSDAFTSFFTPNAAIGNRSPWQLVSDPNVSYIDVIGNVLTVGLAGLYNADAILSAISGLIINTNEQVSEVVKLTVNGSDPIYLYGFSATPSGVIASDGQSFTGNYQVAFVPEPAELALFGIALGGLFLSRRRMSRT